MARNVSVDEAALAEEMRRIGEISERVRLAGFGLAQPLLRTRQGQLAREVARIAARKGPDHPDVGEARAALARATTTASRFDSELGRARVDRPTPNTEDGAGISGLVLKSGAPVAGLTVTAWASNERADFACTNAQGAFALAVPAERGIVLTVRSESGAELYRDQSSESLGAGQLRYREIDLDRIDPPCPDPGDPPPPAPDTFKLVNVVGQAEGDALRILQAQGLQVGEITRRPTGDQAGRVLDQSPKAGSGVRRGDRISLVVGDTAAVAVPDVVGLQAEAVPEVLKRVGLSLGEVRAVDVPGAKEGIVTSQRPTAGSKAVRGDKVDLEVGRRRTDPTVPQPVVRAAMLAEERLRAQGIAADEPAGHLEKRLTVAGVIDEETLDALLNEDQKALKDRLGLRTVADAGKVVAALRRARKELGGRT